MDNKLFMRADEVAKELGVSQAYAYTVVVFCDVFPKICGDVL